MPTYIVARERDYHDPETTRALSVTFDRNRTRYVAHLRIHAAGGTISPGFSITGDVYEPHGTWSGEAAQRNGREWDSGGAIGDKLAEILPPLAIFERVHLAGLDGTPSHARANASYYYPRKDVAGWIHHARKACRDSERFPRFNSYHNELLTEGETIDGDRHSANRWSIDPGAWSFDAIPAYADPKTGDVETIGAMSWREIALGRCARTLGIDAGDLPRELCPVAFAAFVDDQRERWRWDAHDAVALFDSLEAEIGV